MSTSPTATAENRLTSERFADFVEALETLYIRNNIGGRNQFVLAWPEAAVYIFNEELLGFDREGTQDRERRAVLEIEADDKRAELLEILSAIEVKSVENGALKLEYVQAMINQFGRDLSLCIYGRWLVDRFIAPPPEAVASVQQAATAPPPMPPRPVVDDPMDRIKPISVEPDMGPLPEAGPVVREPSAAQKSVSEPEGLIVETQGSAEITLPAAPPPQESMAPVVGGVDKKPGGLKLFKISENGPDSGSGENQ